MTDNYLILIDGEPHRHYDTGQIRTYMSRSNAEKQARVLIKFRRKYIESAKEKSGASVRMPKYEVAKIEVSEIREVIE